MFPPEFDQDYFSLASWCDRLRSWTAKQDGAFLNANTEVVDRMMEEPRTAVRMIINIRADALCDFLASGRYLNRYQLNPQEIGGSAPDDARIEADRRVGTGPAHYFAAAAMGGAGVSYFGDYCIVLFDEFLAPDARLFDRDSYDVLFKPLEAVPDSQLQALKGDWEDDLRAMILLRVLAKLNHDRQIASSGTVIDHVLHNQEYIEVHLQKPVEAIEINQVVEAPETQAIESRIVERQRRGHHVSMHELEWVRRRSETLRRLDHYGIRHRVVTRQGRGYQWR